MGQMNSALTQAKGLLLGFSRLKDDLPEDAQDFPSENGAFPLLEAWAKTAPAGSDSTMVDWMHQELLADWASHMDRLWRDLHHRTGKSR